jgi:predicted ester cyclase
MAGIPPTHKRVSFSGVSVYRETGGKIVESWYVYDLFGFLQQLGAIPVAA